MLVFQLRMIIEHIWITNISLSHMKAICAHSSSVNCLSCVRPLNLVHLPTWSSNGAILKITQVDVSALRVIVITAYEVHICIRFVVAEELV
ncbi:hypothetical protein EG68_06881 [Paragonimus skrjabini miyazakii]|uniref:Uncharacterized protein n=1 Tax=Paragonimus skrjabini miyazakii TaxID=59628 RepID=A0A8S9YSC3_9TREM|nr:hypothetical protein EG68_06881 [Paragonimus skrjabini miyazakii]